MNAIAIGYQFMKIAIFNGSPRIDTQISFSKAYVDYIKKRYPNHEFVEFHIARDIKEFRKGEAAYRALVDTVSDCRGILWQMPVYSALVPAQVKELIELLFDDAEATAAFKGKYSAMISTSLQLFDNWAEDYIQGVCEDLDILFTGAFSGTFYPIIDDKYKISLNGFLDRFMGSIENHVYPPRLFLKERHQPSKLLPFPEKTSEHFENRQFARRVTIVTDTKSTSENLVAMIDTVSKALDAAVKILDLAQTDYDGCSCCMHCGVDFQCLRKDDFQTMHSNYILEADAVIYAGSVKDHYLSYRFKYFFDREFYLNHTPFLGGKPVALIVSGPANAGRPVLESLKSILSLRGGRIVGISSDDVGSAEEIRNGLEWIAKSICSQIDLNAPMPLGFYGAAAARIFRDFVYIAKFPFVKDYKIYNEKRLFKTFPQKRYKVRFLGFLFQMMSLFLGFSKTLKKWHLIRSQKFRDKLFSA
jgi:multimeric flavodoxin WrbA